MNLPQTVGVDLDLAAFIKGRGILMPVRTIAAAKAAKLPLADACALLMMETSGGKNIYGHDPTIFAGRGVVTKTNYAEYKRQRVASKNRKMQGVGPCQLTYWSFQDAADSVGGCWRPLANMTIGFSHLADLIRRDGTQAGFAAYNGSGVLAQSYGRKASAIAGGFALAIAHFNDTRLGWRPFVSGDTDCNVNLLRALAGVARELGPGYRVYIRSGKRTRAEQAVLYARYLRDGHPLAARPGTSRHETGNAADCQIITPKAQMLNIGDYPKARTLLDKHGLCLPVKGESWHAELKP